MRSKEIHNTLFAYLCVSAFYTLFSNEGDLWNAFSYLINYSFVGIIAYYSLEKSTLKTIIINYSLARLIVSTYALYDFSITKNDAICASVVLTISFSFAWTWTFSR